VEKVNPDLVARDEQGKPYTVRYEAVNAMLLNEFLKEHRKVEQMQKQIDALTAGLQKVGAQLELSKPANGLQQSVGPSRKNLGLLMKTNPAWATTLLAKTLLPSYRKHLQASLILDSRKLFGT
jgi:hypothetical protein